MDNKALDPCMCCVDQSMNDPGKECRYPDAIAALKLLARWHHSTCDWLVAGKEYQCSCGKAQADVVIAKALGNH